MLGFVIIITLLVLAILGITVSLTMHWINGAAAADRTPWRPREHALTRDEFTLHQVLGPAAVAAGIDERPLVLIRPRLTDILWLPKTARRARFWERRLRGLKVEFVICRGSDARPLLAVRLPPASHSARGAEADAAIRQALAGAAIPLLALDSADLNAPLNAEELGQRLLSAILESQVPTRLEALERPGAPASSIPAEPARA